MLSDEWNTYHYVKESGSDVQAIEKEVEKIVTVYEEGTLIKSTGDKGAEMMLKQSKMRSAFKWKFPMQLLKKK